MFEHVDVIGENMGLFSIILIGGLILVAVVIGVAIPFMMKEYGKDHDDMIE